jgi:hypothetical protein
MHKANVIYCFLISVRIIFILMPNGFGSLVVSMLAMLVPEFAGSNPAEKILSVPSFGGEVKESVPCPSFAACKRT